MTRYTINELIDNRYLVDSVLSGGFGEVYLCRDVYENNYPIALKTFKFDQTNLIKTQRLQLNFQKEAALWTSLGNHPNIVKCFYMLPVGNQFFLFMELIENSRFEGNSLRDLLNAEGRLTAKESITFVLDICRALKFAQQKIPGMIHRDLKPENVLIGKDNIAKVTDFGLAKVVEEINLCQPEINSLSAFQTFTSVSSSGKSRFLSGTPLYMAPEQWGMKSISNSVDIYAISCVLYEILTGKPTFIDDDITRLAEMHITGVIPDLCETDYLSKELNFVIRRCLSKRPEDRYPSLTELLHSLTEIYEKHFAESPRVPEFEYLDNGKDSTNSGITLTYHGDLLLALKFHNSAVMNTPLDERVYVNRGLTLYALGRTDLAMSDFNQALTINPLYDKGYYNRGIIYFEERKFEEAKTDFEQAISINDKYALAYTNLGQTLLKIGKLEKALFYQYKALEIDSSLVPAYIHRAITLWELNRLDEAEQDFIQACELDPLDGAVHFRLGLFYERQGKYIQAIGCFEKSFDLQYPDAKAMLENTRSRFLGKP